MGIVDKSFLNQIIRALYNRLEDTRFTLDHFLIAVEHLYQFF